MIPRTNNIVEYQKTKYDMIISALYLCVLCIDEKSVIQRSTPLVLAMDDAGDVVSGDTQEPEEIVHFDLMQGLVVDRLKWPGTVSVVCRSH